METPPKLSLSPPFFYLLLQTPDAILHLLDAFCAFFVQRFPTFTLHFFSATSKCLCCWRRSLRRLLHVAAVLREVVHAGHLARLGVCPGDPLRFAVAQAHAVAEPRVLGCADAHVGERAGASRNSNCPRPYRMSSASAVRCPACSRTVWGSRCGSGMAAVHCTRAPCNGGLLLPCVAAPRPCARVRCDGGTCLCPTCSSRPPCSAIRTPWGCGCGPWCFARPSRCHRL